jgi:hypothetical protein
MLSWVEVVNAPFFNINPLKNDTQPIKIKKMF